MRRALEVLVATGDLATLTPELMPLSDLTEVVSQSGERAREMRWAS